MRVRGETVSLQALQQRLRHSRFRFVWLVGLVCGRHLGTAFAIVFGIHM